MPRSSRTLARRRLDPTWLTAPTYVETFGPEVGEIAQVAGLVPDPEQQEILDLTFAVDGRGRSAAFEIDIIGPRQNLKTATILMIELGWLYVTEERLIVHSAHELDTTAEAFRDLKLLIESTPVLAKHLDPTFGKSPGIMDGNGKWTIQLTGDRRIRYKARTLTGGRGLTGDKVVLDEGFALQPSHMGSLLPTLAAVADPQVVTASSAGKLESEVLRDKRDRGRPSDGFPNGRSPRQVYVEYGDREVWSGCRTDDCDHAKTATGCALDDEKRYRRIMPAYGRRVFLETLRAMREAMPPLEFAREFLVWWEDPPTLTGNGAIDLQRWAALTNPAAPKPASAIIVLDVAPNRNASSIGVAGEGSQPGRTLMLTSTRPGTSWVVPALEKILEQGDQQVEEILLHPGQAKVLIPDLKKAGVDYQVLTSADVAQACGWLIETVNTTELDDQGRPVDPVLEHVGQPALDLAVANAITKTTPGEAESWDRRDKKVDITAAVAGGTAAHRWAATVEDYDPLDSIG